MHSKELNEIYKVEVGILRHLVGIVEMEGLGLASASEKAVAELEH